MKRFFVKFAITATPPIIFLLITFSTVILVFNKHVHNVKIRQFIIYSIDNDKIYRQPNFTYTSKDIHITHLESKFSCSNKPLKMLILVTSHPKNVRRRNLIRQTWGRYLHEHKNHDFRTYFVTGKTNDTLEMKKLKEESETYHDLVLGNFKEHFYNLSYKVQAGFEWSYKHCTFEYLLKADDDVFINLNSIFKKLYESQFEKRKLYLGYANIQAWVRRKGKYKVSLDEYADPFYPDYCGGGAFIFSSDVIKDLMPYMNQNPFKVDDVYIGMLALNAGVQATHEPNFKLVEDECKYTNEMMAHHPAKNQTCMFHLYHKMIEENKDSEFIKLHYVDNSRDNQIFANL